MSALRILAAFAALFLAPAAAFAQTSPSAYTSGTRYDAAGRVTGRILPGIQGVTSFIYPAVRNSYDQAGWLVRVERGELAAWQSEAVAPASWSGFTSLYQVDTIYDAAGRKERETTISGGTAYALTQYSYDAVGRLACTAVRMNASQFGGTLPDACTQAGGTVPDRITMNVYDAAGQRLQLREGVGTSAVGTEATWAYNANGQVTTVIDGNGNRAQLHYDGYGRQDCWIFPSPTRPSAFDDTDQTTALDSAGALGGTIVDGQCATGDYERYGYDDVGNRTSLRKRDGSTITYQYDALNRMTAKIVPERTSGSQALTSAQTRDVYYSYDLRNLQLSARFDSQSGEGVTNVYDGFGRLQSSSTDMGGVTRTLSYLYDANGNRLRITHPDTQAFTYAYDGVNRLTGIDEGAGSGATMLGRFGYNDLGQLRTREEQGGSAALYGHDDIGRLNSLYGFFSGGSGNVVTYFGFNPASQIVAAIRDNDAYAWTGHNAANRAYTTNGLNQYTAASSATFGYDANGNLTSSVANPYTDNYTYDVENRLVSVSGAHNATLAYDPLGRLWQVTGASTTRFVYDGDALVAEYNGSNAMTRRYVHGGDAGADDPLVWYEIGDTIPRRWLHRDERGSIVAVTNTAGQPIGINTYDEYGIPNSVNNGRFQYTGQAWLPEVGLYYYKARIYSPTLGRFMQTDPIGYADQFNLYAYATNDPINRRDLTGMMQDQPLCPSNDQTCTNPAVRAPLTQAERAEQDRIHGRNQSYGTLAEIVASSITNAVYDALSQVLPTDYLDNAATAREIGAAGEAQVAELVVSHGWTVVDSQVTIQTAAGIRVADHLVSDGQGGYILVEVKANSATRSFSQARKDYIIGQYGGVIRSRSGLVPYGSDITARTVVIQVTVPR